MQPWDTRYVIATIGAASNQDEPTMKLYGCRTAIIATIVSLLAVGPASAHHLMGGKLPSTFTEGLLSGLGHPVVGPDHLAFLVAIGLIVGVQRLPLALPAFFVAAMAVGVWMHIHAISISAAEVIVGTSVLVVGILVAIGRALSASGWVAVFVVGGLFHGYAFGESIFGAETSPLGAYLLGLVLIQSTLTVGIALLVRLIGASSASQQGPRLLGVGIAGVGFTVLIGHLVPSM